MSVNWEWNAKFGEIDVTQKVGPNEVKGTLSIYHANCLYCLLQEFEDNTYSFYGFCNDEIHLKRLIGLLPYDSYDYELGKCVKKQDNTYYNDSCKWTEIRLDSRDNQSLKLAKIFAQAGFRIVLDKYDYYGKDQRNITQ